MSEKTENTERSEKTGKSEKPKNIHAGHRQRMRKRFIERGIEGFETHEKLEMLLYYAIPRKDTNELAHRLLDRFGTFAGVCNAPIDILQRDFGLTETAAVLLRMIPAMASAYVDSAADGQFVNRHIALDLLRPKFIGATTEKVAVVLSNSKRHLVYSDIISVGSLTATDLPIRKIVDLSLRMNARYVYLAHNHPSELCMPSRPDLETTHTISETLYALGISLVDHFVITSNDYFSIRSEKKFSKVFVDKLYEF